MRKLHCWICDHCRKVIYPNPKALNSKTHFCNSICRALYETSKQEKEL